MTRKLTAAQALEILDDEARRHGQGSTLRPVAMTTGRFRFTNDEALGNEDETRVECPRCNGKGETQERTETARGYSIRHAECCLCRGSRMVTPVECAAFRAGIEP